MSFGQCMRDYFAAVWSWFNDISNVRREFSARMQTTEKAPFEMVKPMVFAETALIEGMGIALFGFRRELGVLLGEVKRSVRSPFATEESVEIVHRIAIDLEHEITVLREIDCQGYTSYRVEIEQGFRRLVDASIALDNLIGRIRLYLPSVSLHELCLEIDTLAMFFGKVYSDVRAAESSFWDYSRFMEKYGFIELADKHRDLVSRLYGSYGLLKVAANRLRQITAYRR